MPKRNSGARLEWRDERKVWEIQWYERGQCRRRSTGTDDRRQADRQLAAHIIAEPQDKTRPRDPSERLIAEVLTAYGEGRGVAVTDTERLGYAIKALIPFWGSLSVGDINETLCRAYCSNRGKAANTVRRELTVLRAAVNFDYENGRLTRPVAVWLPERGESKDRWLTRNEAASLLRAARRDPRSRWHLPLFIMLGLYTAARKEAILSLRWPQVDLVRGRIDLNPPGRERTSKGRPMIPIPRKLGLFLRYARRHGTDLGHVVTYQGAAVANIKHAFATACRNAGLENVTPHTLRHTSATWMTAAGVPFPEIARYLGHSDSRTTEAIYAHHAADYLNGARDALDRGRRR